MLAKAGPHAVFEARLLVHAGSGTGINRVVLADGVLIFGVIHLAMVSMAAGVFLMLVRSERRQGWEGDHDDFDDDGGGGGGGGNQPLHWSPKPRPSGTLPMRDAEQAPLRLRGRGSLADIHRRRERRPAHAPSPSPVRRPDRVG